MKYTEEQFKQIAESATGFKVKSFDIDKNADGCFFPSYVAELATTRDDLVFEISIFSDEFGALTIESDVAISITEINKLDFI